ncbi:hypothetical protein EWI07_03465 [Sporolactobacillus sp. THM7-4]|nr:hypothetical protein EWI07_03465 [Sporolactobacillus sp. THM7-4]
MTSETPAKARRISNVLEIEVVRTAGSALIRRRDCAPGSKQKHFVRERAREKIDDTRTIPTVAPKYQSARE